MSQKTKISSLLRKRLFHDTSIAHNNLQLYGKGFKVLLFCCDPPVYGA